MRGKGLRARFLAWFDRAPVNFDDRDRTILCPRCRNIVHPTRPHLCPQGD